MTRIQSGAALEALAASNQVVADEVAEFKRNRQDRSVAAAAEQSARALSGYGIAVAAQAFVELAD